MVTETGERERGKGGKGERGKEEGGYFTVEMPPSVMEATSSRRKGGVAASSARRNWHFECN